MEIFWIYVYILIRFDCNDYFIIVGINYNYFNNILFMFYFEKYVRNFFFFNLRLYIVIIYLFLICLYISFLVKKNFIIFELEIFVYRLKSMNKKRYVCIVLFLIF